MPDSETFDAFYARTVWNVTSQMHELAGDDSTADHAIREAYAKAYQQWYQVSGYRDSEGWVLATAKDAYERRLAETGGLGQSAAAEASDSGTWPGLFRPAAQPGQNAGSQGQPVADPDGTLAPPRRGWAGRKGIRAAAPNGYPAAGAMAADALAGNGTPGGAAPTHGQADGLSAWLGPASGTAPPTRDLSFGGHVHGRPGGNRLGGARPSGLTPHRNLIVAGVALAALVIAGITYYATSGGHNAPAQAASQGTGAKSAGQPHMLAAGHTGNRSAIPWSLVGTGWALAEFSTAAPNSAGQASAGGKYSTYLVDPEGGKYTISASSGSTVPQLMAWSGNKQNALLNTGGGTALGTTSYELLNVRTGHLAPLQLPTGVVAIGFTRPDGEAILALHQGPAEFRLQRYDLTGQLQASLESLPRKAGETLPSAGCSTACALSSPLGLTDVWGILGDGMQVLSNAGGKPHMLRVKDSGHPASCMPLTWWSNSTILASCTAAGAPATQQLWLVPADGSAPSALSPAVVATQGGTSDAWLAGQTTYVTSATSHQCASAPSGPGGLDILPLGQGTSAAIMIPGSTHNFSTIVAAQGKRLLVLTQTHCPGTSSLVWFDPSTGHSQTVISAPANEVGVIAAVPFGNGPTAVTSGY